MPDLTTLVMFGVASVALLLIPGPAVLYIVTRSVALGRSAGVLSVLGVHVGSLVHIGAAALGLSALLASSAAAFTVVKYLGAAYLVLLGIQQLRRRDHESAEPAPDRRSLVRVFGQGIVVNVLNPKTAVFFVAFLPQFVDPARGPVLPQIVVLGLCFTALGMLSDGAYAVLAGSLAERFRRSLRIRRGLARTSGVVYLGLGVGAALAGEPARQS